ncbi:MAG: DUF11 domain-containing protein [Chloroflexi bacterium]|nr:MAG: DUF11 domain-containing protein [Chloroflexota bacterium]
MVSGIFDHYFVNINFPNAVTQFWLFIGLALAATHMDEQRPVRRGEEMSESGSGPARTKRSSRIPLVILAVLLPLLLLGMSLAGGAGIARAQSDRLPPARPEIVARTSSSQSPIPNSYPENLNPKRRPELVEGSEILSPDILRKVEPDLLKAALENRDEQHRFLVHMRSPAPDLTALQALPKSERRRAIIDRLQETANTAQRAVRAYLAKARAEGHVETYKPFWIFNGLAVTGDASALLDLAARSDVAMIRGDHKHWLPEPDVVPGTYTANPGEGLEWGVERIRAEMVWQALGIDGTGVVVASLDTGVDWQHPDLKAAYRGYNEKGLAVHLGNWYSATDEDYLYPGDGHGHGTHTTATMVGQNGVGVAPGAKWIAVKIFHNQGYTFDSWIHDAFQWVLAPAGNPDLAPDVVNGSWGNDIPEDQTLRDDIRLLRVAGIVPVFAVGNNGPEPRSLGSPGSYPEVLAVGALDQDGEVARFSARGPSPWGEIKPEVVAPGTGVRSAVPGGGRQAWNGTSMATPHVSGVVALMLQADPTLTQDKIEEILKSTATPIGNPVPNNDAGWGLVDAYRAVASVMNVGFLSGRVTRAIDGEPVAGAQVSVAHRDGEAFAHTVTDADGYYELTLPPGPYELSVTAFAYEPAEVHGIRISEDARMARDVTLTLQPAGALFGRVTDATTGGPLSATITVVGTPVSVQTETNVPGQYTLSLPPGDYELKAVSRGHLVGHAFVSIVVDQSTKQNFSLSPAPSILLVDSGGWYYGSQSRFFTEALDTFGYTYEVWRIKDLDRDLPTAKDLSAYDIVIWSSPRDAPGLIGASGTITNYLEAGGRLLITGQDVGYWDGGGSRDFFAPYYRDYLRSVYVKDDSGYRVAFGTDETDFGWLRFGLGRADSARNQHFPDQIAALDTEHAQIAFRYGDPEENPEGPPAGLVVGQCLPYRVVYLAFGFEGVEDVEVRAELMEQAIQVLMASPPELGVTVAAEPSPASDRRLSRQIVPAGSTAQHVIKVRNTGSAHDTFHLSLQGGSWPATLWDGDFSRPLSDSVRIEACEAITVGVKVEVPPGTPHDTMNEVVFRAESHSKVNGKPASDEMPLQTKTPAGVLLVDDDRWINVEEYYQRALESLGVGYDDWRVGWNTGEALGPPSSDILDLYPAVIWFTGYDWFQTLTPDQEMRLAEYLARGGRLFLSSQDYMYTNGLRDFARDYLGVVSYTEDLTTTVVTGEAGSDIGNGLGPYELDYPFPNHSDGIEPAEGAVVVFRGDRNQPVATSYAPAASNFKTVFFAFPFEALSHVAAEPVMERILDWLSPLHSSSVTFDRSVAAEGDELTVAVTLRNDGPLGEQAKVRAHLPPQAEYVIGSLKGADYDPIARVMWWDTNVPAGETVTVTYQLQLAPSVPDATMVTHQVDIVDNGGLKLRRYASVRVDAPNLSGSEKSVSQEQAGLGDILTYRITLVNSGTVDGGLMSLDDELPPQIELVNGSLSASSGRTTSDGRRIIWEGRVLRGQPVTISYRARVVGHGVITNIARVDDGTGVVTEHSATTVVPTKLYLPLLQLK